MNMNDTLIEVLDGGVTAAKGFKAAGVAAGIKYTDRLDMALVYSESPAKVAGMFTSNVVKAAPVKYDMKIVKESPYVQAVVVNSGIANAATGEMGMKLCSDTAEAVAKKLKIKKATISNAHQYFLIKPFCFMIHLPFLYQKIASVSF